MKKVIIVVALMLLASPVYALTVEDIDAKIKMYTQTLLTLTQNLEKAMRQADQLRGVIMGLEDLKSDMLKEEAVEDNKGAIEGQEDENTN